MDYLFSKRWIWFVLSLLFFGAALFVFLSPVNSPGYQVHAVKGLDKIVFGADSAAESVSKLSEEKSIFAKKNDGKEYDSLFPLTKEIEIRPELVGGQYVFHKDFSSDLSFQLTQDLYDGALLRAVYDEKSRKILFINGGDQFQLGETAVSSVKRVLYSLSGVQPDSVIRIGEKNILLTDYKGDAFFELATIQRSPILLYIPYKKNILPIRYSRFQYGLWSPTVTDCSKTMDGDAKISMGREYFLGERYLRLSSENHFACTSRVFRVPLKKDGLYRFSFDYINRVGSQIRYYYHAYPDTVDETLSKAETIVVPQNVKQKFLTLLQPKQSHEKMDVFFYAPGTGSGEVSSLYNNVQLVEYADPVPVHLQKENVTDKEDAVEEFNLKDQETPVTFSISSKNLLDEKAASFEGNTWSTEVRDCCKLNAGAPIISMESVNQSTVGSSSLLLAAKNHCACVTKTFPVKMKDSSIYKISFDCKAELGGSPQYYYSVEGLSGQLESGSETIDATSTDWSTYSTTFQPEEMSKSITVYLYASSDGEQEVRNVYDNIRLEELAPKDFSLYKLTSKREVDRTDPVQSIEYKAVSYDGEEVFLHGVSGSFILTADSPYGDSKVIRRADVSQWPSQETSRAFRYAVNEDNKQRQASIEEVNSMFQEGEISVMGTEFISKNNAGVVQNQNLKGTTLLNRLSGKPIEKEKHYELNDGSNAWLIDPSNLCFDVDACFLRPDGRYDIRLRIEENGRIVRSLLLRVILLGCSIGFLGISFLFRKKYV